MAQQVSIGRRLPAVCVCLLLGAARAAAQEAPGQPEFQISPRGYLQLDWRGYPDWNRATGTGRLNRGTLDVRRARVGLDGRWRAVSFEFTADPGDYDGVWVKDLYAQIRFSRAVRLRAGQFKLPGSREYGVSGRSLELLERAALADAISGGRDLGAMVVGEVGSRLDYRGGVFAGDGNGRASRAGTTASGRVELALARSLELGGSVSVGRTRAADTEDPNGLVGRSSAGYRFFDQVYVDGRRSRAGVDLAWTRRPWRVTGEFMQARDERRAQGLDFEDLPSVVATGWSVAATREFGRQTGASWWRWRAIDVSGRIDYLGFDDSAPPTGRDSVRPRATDIRPRSVLASTAGVSWRPTAWSRVMVNAAWERYRERRSAPEPGRSGFLALGTRLQVQLP